MCLTNKISLFLSFNFGQKVKKFVTLFICLFLINFKITAEISVVNYLAFFLLHKSDILEASKFTEKFMKAKYGDQFVSEAFFEIINVHDDAKGDLERVFDSPRKEHNEKVHIPEALAKAYGERYNNELSLFLDGILNAQDEENSKKILEKYRIKPGSIEEVLILEAEHITDLVVRHIRDQILLGAIKSNEQLPEYIPEFGHPLIPTTQYISRERSPNQKLDSKRMLELAISLEQIYQDIIKILLENSFNEALDKAQELISSINSKRTQDIKTNPTRVSKLEPIKNPNSPPHIKCLNQITKPIQLGSAIN